MATAAPGFDRRRSIVVSMITASRLWPAALCSLLGIAVVATPVVLGQRFDILDAGVILRIAIAVMVAGFGFSLDDPAKHLTEALRLGLADQARLRMALATVIFLPCWLAMLALVPSLSVDDRQLLRLPMLFVEAPTLVLWVFAVAATGIRIRAGNGGSIAAPAGFVACLMIAMLPASLALFVNPGSPDFLASRVRWAVFAITGAVALRASVQALDQGRTPGSELPGSSVGWLMGRAGRR